jgi:carbon monoxide dehydrogenase subunit G
MTCFEYTVRSSADISADRKQVWDTLTDPKLLPELTPLLSKIDVDGDTWRWHMMRIGALGVSVIPVFTEKMTFVDGERIEYAHQPPNGKREPAGAQGTYLLRDVDGGTHLDITLTLRIDLPLPRASRRPVHQVMKAIMDRTGDRFSTNLLEHLGAHEL